MFIHGHEKEAFPLFLSCVNKGYLGGVGYCLCSFYDNHGITRDEFINKYVNKLLSIENSDDADILVSQGYCYDRGYGVNKDYNKAINCFNKALAIDKNHAVALHWLGYCYYYGYGVSENENKAGELFVRSAQLNFLEAINDVISGYKNGDYGLIKDKNKSEYWEKEKKKIESKKFD